MSDTEAPCGRLSPIPERGREVQGADRTRAPSRGFVFSGDWSHRSGVNFHDPGCDERRKDGSSNRQRAEAYSASLTRMHGVVWASSKAHRPRDLQRVPFLYGCLQRGLDLAFELGWASFARNPSYRVSIEDMWEKS